ncbi:ATP-grasp domain-containing protein [Chryseolinea sp. H1M3-3]|uniref:ATP-grasp domain-containing protein n=1 Tax=Chryseolinea sp. H1M3-3 TaxID=3034144 RepID=UPI0023EB1C33|nr:ATP-grasp domain-containing protein [Chryseolinea sp. H1M3-3]
MSPRKKILVIGAGWEQYSLIKKIKDKGLELIITHPSFNPEGAALADVSYVKNSRDIASHIKIAEAHNIDAVVTDNCDFSFFTASVVAARLKLPFAEIQSAIFSNDKFAQREQCRKLGIKQPDFFRVRTLQELADAAKVLGFPVVLKPVDSRGTFGVSIIHDTMALENAFYDAINNSSGWNLICEKFIKGTLVTVDGFCFKNGHQSLAVASRKYEPGLKPVTKEIIYPAEFPDSLNRKLFKNHNAVAAALNYRYGHTHGEYIVSDNEEIYLVECTNRGGGVYTSSVIVPYLTEIDLNEILLNQSLGQDMFEVENKGLTFLKNSAMLTFLDFEVGKVIRNINVEEVKALPFVLRYRTIYNVNDMVESIENCASRHSMLVIKGSTKEAVVNNLKVFKEKLKIDYYP